MENHLVRWRKPAVKVSETYEASRDLPLDLLQMRLRLALNEFRIREWKHFTHELHRSTSNKFPTNATDKNGNPLVVDGWRALFDNAFENPDGSAETALVTWDDVKLARAKMLRRVRDAVRPNILIVNATTEADLSEDSRVNAANVLGGADTFFRTGTLPNIYGLTVVVIPDAHHGYFSDDVNRKNAQFVPTNDAFLLTTQNGPTVMRHTREPISTETWRVFDGQKNAMNMWERYEFGTFRYTNILRLVKDNPDPNVSRLA